MRNIGKRLWIVALVIIVAPAGYLYYLLRDLPAIDSVKDYQPNLVTKVYSYDNQLIGEFYIERRVVVPFEKIPRHVLQAFLAAEDSKFYEHSGINYASILRALYKNITAGKVSQGGSTITQQVARTFFLSSERKISRKIKEALLTYRLEKNLTKNEILNLYLNQIYFGSGAYGIETASEKYFAKGVERLTLAEAAVLAGLPPSPSNYSPLVNFKAAKERQAYVLKRMVEERYITGDKAEKAADERIAIRPKEPAQNLWIGPYFTEHVRRYVEDKYGDDVLYKGGLNIHTTLDVDLQKAANHAVREGLRAYDKRHGYRGPLQRLKPGEETEAFKAELSKRVLKQPSKDYEGESLYQGIITSVNARAQTLGVDLGARTGIIAAPDMEWAKLYNDSNDPDGGRTAPMERVFKRGDVIEVRVKAVPDDNHLPIPLALEQTPVIQAALLAIEPETGRVKAMVGGGDFAVSQYNRAVQAFRQPGSSFKPIIYAAALDKDFTPATVIMDTPLVFGEDPLGAEKEKLKEPKIKEVKPVDPLKKEEPLAEQWRPQNYDEQFNGPTTVREAMAKSRNIITIKILNAIGVDYAISYAKRLGITSPLARDLSLALGSSAVSLMEMTTAFATFDNQGVKPEPFFVTKITAKDGALLEDNVAPASLSSVASGGLRGQKSDPKTLPGEASAVHQTDQANAGEPPVAGAVGEAATGPALGPALGKETAYILTSLLQGVIENGTGQRAKALGRPAAGKTGTTNNHNDAWFIGYVPGLTAGAWIGYDEEKQLGKGETGARAALPIWLRFMQEATMGTPVKDFPVPDGVEFARIDPETGLLANRTTENPVFEVFKTGTAPKTASKARETGGSRDFFMMDTGSKSVVKPRQEKEAVD